MGKGRKKLKVSPLKGTTEAEEASFVPKTKEELVKEFDKLKEEEERLNKEIAELESKGITIDLKPQMEALHEYNEMKDAAQVVLGYIADLEQITITEIHKRYNVPTD